MKLRHKIEKGFFEMDLSALLTISNLSNCSALANLTAAMCYAYTGKNNRLQNLACKNQETQRIGQAR